MGFVLHDDVITHVTILNFFISLVILLISNAKAINAKYDSNMLIETQGLGRIIVIW